MKTAISIPDSIFQSAEIMAHQLAISILYEAVILLQRHDCKLSSSTKIAID
jgi:hypothetical protein